MITLHSIPSKAAPLLAVAGLLWPRATEESIAAPASVAAEVSTLRRVGFMDPR